MDKQQLQVSNNTSLQNHPSDHHHHHHHHRRQEEDAVLLFHCSHQTYSESKQNDDDYQWSLLQENNVFDEKELQAFHDPYIINNSSSCSSSSSDFFQRMATKTPEKTVQLQMINDDHFHVLVDDIKLIELENNCFFSPNCTKPNKKITQTSSSSKRIMNMTSSVHHQTKKGARWTKEEHEKFLMGLSRYGKGDWRNISRNCVITKTPTQVASHAQKYFIRLAKSSSTSQDLSFKP